MSWKQTLEKAGEGHWVLPKRKAMRCEAHLFLSDRLLFGEDGGGGVEEAVFDQVVNATTFPGATRVVLTPDCHVGYGVPIGTAIETEGTLLPTAAGYDIGCGMVQLATSLTRDEVADPDKRRRWINEVITRIGIGVGMPGSSTQKISSKLLPEVLRHGAKALGRSNDVAERASLPVDDDRVDVPDKAWAKRNQLGSLGGGNHFCEMQIDGEDQVWVMLHTGSRGFGWNIAKQFFVQGAAALGLARSNEDHVWFDVDSTLGHAYWNLHNMAANFAIANRLLIAEAVGEALEHVFGGEARVYYEISHNLIQKENGRFIARKGATRAFPGDHASLKGTKWEATGHPFSFPGRWRRGRPFCSPTAARQNRSTRSITGRGASSRAPRPNGCSLKKTPTCAWRNWAC